jgi:hypothetical protein
MFVLLKALPPDEDEYIKDIVFQQDPDRIIWVLTESGKLLGLTFDKGQEVIAWHKHDIGGKIESMSIVLTALMTVTVRLANLSTPVILIPPELLSRLYASDFQLSI